MIMFVVERGEVNGALCVSLGVGEAVSATCSARLFGGDSPAAPCRAPCVACFAFQFFVFSDFPVLALGMAPVLLV